MRPGRSAPAAGSPRTRNGPSGGARSRAHPGAARGDPARNGTMSGARDAVSTTPRPTGPTARAAPQPPVAGSRRGSGGPAGPGTRSRAWSVDRPAGQMSWSRPDPAGTRTSAGGWSTSGGLTRRPGGEIVHLHDERHLGSRQRGLRAASGAPRTAAGLARAAADPPWPVVWFGLEGDPAGEDPDRAIHVCGVAVDDGEREPVTEAILCEPADEGGRRAWERFVTRVLRDLADRSADGLPAMRAVWHWLLREGPKSHCGWPQPGDPPRAGPTAAPTASALTCRVIPPYRSSLAFRPEGPVLWRRSSAGRAGES